MTRILLIDPDRDRGATLRQLIRGRLAAEVLTVTSAGAAIATMAERLPTLILTSSLIGPSDERRLTAHLRQASDLRHVPVLTVPFVLDAAATNDSRRRGFTFRLTRRTPRWPMYDLGAVTARIKDAIEESQRGVALAAIGYAVPTLIDVPPRSPLNDSGRAAKDEPESYLRSRKKRARRLTMGDLPWLSCIKLERGPELRLINISRSGLLVESGTRLAPGTSAAIELAGPFEELSMPARVVRTDVSAVDSLGVTYRAAAVFEQPLDSLLLTPTPPETPDPAGHIVELVGRIAERAAIGADPDALRAEFEAGIGEIVNAREIRVREAPFAENDGGDSVYFTIPAPDGSRAVLQAVFDRGYQPLPQEFEALKAASVASADVLQFIDPARPGVAALLSSVA